VRFACRFLLAGELLAAIGLTLATSAESQENRVPNAQGENPAWRFSFTPYLWGAGLNGQVGVAGRSSDLNIGVGDVIDDFDIGVMGLVEARKELSKLKLPTDRMICIRGVCRTFSEHHEKLDLGRTIVRARFIELNECELIPYKEKPPEPAVAGPSKP